jgi:hypothetical protein
MTMANDSRIAHRDLWITLYSAVVAGSAVTPALPGAVAERAREVTDEAVQVILSRWPDLPADYQVAVVGRRK